MDILDLLDHIDENHEENQHIRRHFRNPNNPFEEYDDVTFKSRYKLSKNSAQDMIALLQHDLVNSGRNHASAP